MKKIEAGFNQAYNLLGTFIADEKNFVQMEKAGLAMVESIKKGGKIFSCGNGGSMADAMHFAEELTGRFRDERPSIPAIAIADSSHITCTANDYGFECIFSRYLEGLAREGDVLLAISTSGNSANIVKAAETALKLGMKVVALTGKTGGKLGQMDVIEIRVPFMGYADRVQEIHIKIIHNLIDFIERNM